MQRAILPIFILIIMIAAAYYFFRPQTAVGPISDSSTSNNEENNLTDNSLSLAFPGILPDAEIDNKQAVISTDKGEIVFELYADKAPGTVSNFIYLTQKGFYNGLTFHRVETGFVIQGGDPNGDGTGGPGYPFSDEPVVGDYLKGTVAMANSGENTNGSQFFICLDNLPDLPKKYNLFGQVTSGMDVVSNIKVGDVIKSITIETIQ